MQKFYIVFSFVLIAWSNVSFSGDNITNEISNQSNSTDYSFYRELNSSPLLTPSQAIAYAFSFSEQSTSNGILCQLANPHKNQWDLLIIMPNKEDSVSTVLIQQEQEDVNMIDQDCMDSCSDDATGIFDIDDIDSPCSK